MFPYYKRSRPSTGPTQPTSQWVPAFFPRGKEQGHIIIIIIIIIIIKQLLQTLSSKISTFAQREQQ
jgi:hypothetical protein